MPHVLQVSPRAPEPDPMARAAAALREGLLVAFPTDTVYGLACDPGDPAAVDRLYAAKGRPRDLPLILLLADADDAPALARDWPPAAQEAADHFWPGPLTLVVPRAPSVPAAITAGRDSIGLRVPDHAVARAFIRAAGFAPATTSANRSGGPDPLTAAQALEALGPHLAVVLDAGPVPLGAPSTVLDLTQSPPVVLRQGALSLDDLRRVLPDIGAPRQAP